MDMPDISGITIDTSLLLKCVNIWRMSGFSGAPPDPFEVAYMNDAQQEVVIMANFVDFVRDEPKRLQMIGGAAGLGDIRNG